MDNYLSRRYKYFLICSVSFINYIFQIIFDNFRRADLVNYIEVKAKDKGEKNEKTFRFDFTGKDDGNLA